MVLKEIHPNRGPLRPWGSGKAGIICACVETAIVKAHGVDTILGILFVANGHF